MGNLFASLGLETMVHFSDPATGSSASTAATERDRKAISDIAQFATQLCVIGPPMERWTKQYLERYMTHYQDDAREEGMQVGYGERLVLDFGDTMRPEDIFNPLEWATRVGHVCDMAAAVGADFTAGDIEPYGSNPGCILLNKGGPMVTNDFIGCYQACLDAARYRLARDLPILDCIMPGGWPKPWRYPWAMTPLARERIDESTYNMRDVPTPYYGGPLEMKPCEYIGVQIGGDGWPVDEFRRDSMKLMEKWKTVHPAMKGVFIYSSILGDVAAELKKGLL